jgi:two-component system alkaline phosphatase synthesis response regulator PhoP
VLVVEDEASIASFVSLYLKNAGYSVKAVSNGSDALAQVEVEQPALIVLDLMLPDIDGIEICRRIRQRRDIPILMLTARDEDIDKIIGLEVGADDYMTKPFNPRELVARVKSILRRSAPAERKESAQIRHGDLLVDSGRREAFVGEDEIQLAPKEFDLLWELLDHRGLVLTRDQLLERRRHTDRRRPRPAAAPEARRRVADRHRLGCRLQGRTVAGFGERRVELER